MILIIFSLTLGLLGLFIGASLGEGFSYFFCFIGILSPALFVLEKMYNNSKINNQLEVNSNSNLDTLKSYGILTDIEYEKAYSKLDEVKDETENKKKYDECVNTLYELVQGNVICEDEFKKKIGLLKTLYKQE
jgi:hypothetical protein